MKKYLLLLASAALLFAGCAKEEQIAVTETDGDQVTVTVTAGLTPEGTKAAADNDGNAAKVNHWVLQVREGDDLFYKEERDVTAGTTQQTYELKLFKNQTYTLLFWADTKGAYTTNDLRAVSVVGSVANTDSRDAFSASVVDYTSVVSESKTITLTRPFAQLNIITNDLEALKKEVLNYEKYKPSDLKVVATVPTTFNVQTQTAGEATEQTLTATASYADFLLGKPETTLFMDYIFASKENADIHNIDFSFTSNNQPVSYEFKNIPLQRNYRTNIKGQLMSNDSEWTVVIDPIWTAPEYTEELWSAGMITPVTPIEDVYTINLPSELAWIAQQVNSGNTFAGKTVKLAKDIDLNNGKWTPMGGVSSYPSVAFHGTLDGNNHKILNLNCSDNTKNYAAAALIGGGHCTVKDLTIENVKVSSTHYAAALVAYNGDGGLVLSNCKVKNGTITSTPEWLGTEYDNGDKAGGLVGVAQACSITGCSVEGLVIKAYRDLGGIAGAAKCADIKNNTVKNSTITADQTVNSYGQKDYNVGAIVGRSLEGSVDASNTSEGVITKTIGNAVEKALDEATAGSTVTVAENVSNIVIPATLAENVTLKQAENVVVDKISIPAGADIKGLVLEEFTPSIQAISGTDFNNGFIDISKDAKVENLLIQKCDFIGPNSKNRTAIFIEPSEIAQPKTIEIKDCSCTGTRYFVYTNGQIPGTTIKVTNCEVTNMFSWAIMVNNGNVAGIDIQNCTFSGGDIAKTLDGNKDTNFTFTFKNNTITGTTANFSLKAKPENTFISGNTKNGVAWNPSIGVLN